MDSNEEYLDQLLKSLSEQEDSVNEAGQTEPETADLPADLSAGIPADLGFDYPEEEASQEKEKQENTDFQSIDDLLKMVSKDTNPAEAEEELQPEPASEESAAPDLDAALSMSQDEIEQLLAANKSETGEKESNLGEMEPDDLNGLMAGLDGDSSEEVQEISDLLNKADHDEPMDDALAALLQGLKEEEPQDKAYSAEDLFGDEETEQQPEKPERKKRKERVKKEKKPRRSRKNQETPQETVPTSAQAGTESVPDIAMTGIIEGFSPEAEPVKAEKKPGLWKKLMDALTEEDEEEVMSVSDENDAILQQMEQEDRAKAGGTNKKASKKADKKKKGKGAKAAGTGEDEAEEGSQGKKKKEKKPRKEKKEKEKPILVEEEVPVRKLSMKKVLPILAAALVVTVAYVIISQLYIDHANKQKAVDAFYAGDYQECYELLFGQDLNDSQAVMYHKSRLVLKMERAKKNYQTLLLEGKELDALDYLVQFLCRYEEYRLEGQEWNSLDVVEETYTGMNDLLTANYGLTQAQAMEIAALESDVDYTLALLAVLEGDYGQEEPAGEAPEDLTSDYEDLLPEELEDQAEEFIDTIE